MRGAAEGCCRFLEGVTGLKRKLAAAFLSALWLSALPAAAQSYTVLHAFELPPMQPYGNLVQGTDGNFYGTMSQEGPLVGGVVFKLGPARVKEVL